MNRASKLVSIYDSQGIRREIAKNYYGWVEQAFMTEADEFTACCLDGTTVPVKLRGTREGGGQIKCALQESLRPGRKIWFDEVGRRMEMARCREGNVRVVGRRGRGEGGFRAVLHCRNFLGMSVYE